MPITKPTSRCSKAGCDGTEFEAVVRDVDGSDFQYLFIQCKACGTVAGVMDYWNIGELIERLAKRQGYVLTKNRGY